MRRHEPIESPTNFFMAQSLFTFNLREALFNFAEKPLVVVHQPFDGLYNNGIAVAPLLGGKA